MGNPTKKQFNKVINNFKKIMEKWPESPVTMLQSEVNHCGSPMCHGGWYATLLPMTKIGSMSFMVSYSDGAKAIAQDLGFLDEEKLKNWAYENPELWGNKDGKYMFSSDSAFTGYEYISVVSLNQIVTHWEQVRDRVYPPKK